MSPFYGNMRNDEEKQTSFSQYKQESEICLIYPFENEQGISALPSDYICPPFTGAEPRPDV